MCDTDNTLNHTIDHHHHHYTTNTNTNENIGKYDRVVKVLCEGSYLNIDTLIMLILGSETLESIAHHALLKMLSLYRSKGVISSRKNLSLVSTIQPYSRRYWKLLLRASLFTQSDRVSKALLEPWIQCSVEEPENKSDCVTSDIVDIKEVSHLNNWDIAQNARVLLGGETWVGVEAPNDQNRDNNIRYKLRLEDAMRVTLNYAMSFENVDLKVCKLLFDVHARIQHVLYARDRRVYVDRDEKEFLFRDTTTTTSSGQMDPKNTMSKFNHEPSNFLNKKSTRNDFRDETLIVKPICVREMVKKLIFMAIFSNCELVSTIKYSNLSGISRRFGGVFETFYSILGKESIEQGQYCRQFVKSCISLEPFNLSTTEHNAHAQLLLSQQQKKDNSTSSSSRRYRGLLDTWERLNQMEFEHMLSNVERFIVLRLDAIHFLIEIAKKLREFDYYDDPSITITYEMKRHCDFYHTVIETLIELCAQYAYNATRRIQSSSSSSHFIEKFTVILDRFVSKDDESRRIFTKFHTCLFPLDVVLKSCIRPFLSDNDNNTNNTHYVVVTGKSNMDGFEWIEKILDLFHHDILGGGKVSQNDIRAQQRIEIDYTPLENAKKLKNEFLFPLIEKYCQYLNLVYSTLSPDLYRYDTRLAQHFIQLCGGFMRSMWCTIQTEIEKYCVDRDLNFYNRNGDDGSERDLNFYTIYQVDEVLKASIQYVINSLRTNMIIPLEILKYLNLDTLDSLLKHFDYYCLDRNILFDPLPLQCLIADALTVQRYDIVSLIEERLESIYASKQSSLHANYEMLQYCFRTKNIALVRSFLESQCPLGDTSESTRFIFNVHENMAYTIYHKNIYLKYLRETQDLFEIKRNSRDIFPGPWWYSPKYGPKLENTLYGNGMTLLLLFVLIENDDTFQKIFEILEDSVLREHFFGSIDDIKPRDNMIDTEFDIHSIQCRRLTQIMVWIVSKWNAIQHTTEREENGGVMRKIYQTLLSACTKYGILSLRANLAPLLSLGIQNNDYDLLDCLFALCREKVPKHVVVVCESEQMSKKYHPLMDHYEAMLESILEYEYISRELFKSFKQFGYKYNQIRHDHKYYAKKIYRKNNNASDDDGGGGVGHDRIELKENNNSHNVIQKDKEDQNARWNIFVGEVIKLTQDSNNQSEMILYLCDREGLFSLGELFTHIPKQSEYSIFDENQVNFTIHPDTLQMLSKKHANEIQSLDLEQWKMLIMESIGIRMRVKHRRNDHTGLKLIEMALQHFHPTADNNNILEFCDWIINNAIDRSHLFCYEDVNDPNVSHLDHYIECIECRARGDDDSLREDETIIQFLLGYMKRVVYSSSNSTITAVHKEQVEKILISIFKKLMLIETNVMDWYLIKYIISEIPSIQIPSDDRTQYRCWVNILIQSTNTDSIGQHLAIEATSIEWMRDHGLSSEVDFRNAIGYIDMIEDNDIEENIYNIQDARLLSFEKLLSSLVFKGYFGLVKYIASRCDKDSRKVEIISTFLIMLQQTDIIRSFLEQDKISPTLLSNIWYTIRDRYQLTECREKAQFTHDLICALAPEYFKQYPIHLDDLDD